MREIDNWSTAFPIRPASQAVEALLDSWRDLAREWRPHFNKQTREPQLTRALKTHIERVTAPRRGLLGVWAAESVQNEMNFHTGELIEERRTDIIFGWNNKEIAIQLVFEFKKLSRYSSSTRKYLGADGLGRFVEGIYAQGQSVAVMVGILMTKNGSIVAPLKKSISDPSTIASLRIVLDSEGNACREPSQIFDAAEFDTEHGRNRLRGPGQDTIRIAHLFLSFGYP